MTRLRQLRALMKKEILQVLRDPSSILIAFVLPLILLFIFGFGLSLDARHVKVAVVLEDRSPTAQSLYQAFASTDYMDALPAADRKSAENSMINGQSRAILVVPGDFTRQLSRQHRAKIQLLTDGAETNTATILENYVLGIVQKWLAHQARGQNMEIREVIVTKPRIYFNPELNTRSSLIPASIVLIMAIIGTLLTALVVAREWERGTMEAMLATPVRKSDMIFGKLFPYYILGIGSVTLCTLCGVFLFDVPFRGSVFALFLVSTLFLIVTLGQGYLISTITKNQFLASQIALLTAFVPNYMLSGALFEISSMPVAIRTITYLFPARYFLICMQTIFMAGDVWPLLLSNMFCMLLIAAVLFAATIIKTPKRLE
ncbi:MAG: ABC transporter permease [Planctomycetaceae bacterium]|jgi:ABC-2 type transport system permease protein|nr:ABC transporter permease [Planctomycetaceae bacterium]